MTVASLATVLDSCNAITTELYCSASDLCTLREEWTSLYRRAVGATPFQSPAWLIPWSRIWGADRSRVIVVRNETDEVIAIVPGARMGDWLELGGSGVGDYLAPLVSEAAADLASGVLGQTLDGVACAFHDVPCALPWPRKDSTDWRVASGATCMAIPLPDSIGAFRSSLPPGLKRNLRRYGERLASDFAVQIRTATEPADVFAALEALFTLHGRQWQARGEPGVFDSDDVRAFHRLVVPALHRERLLRLHCLHVDGAIAGVIYAIVDRGRAFSYIGGLDPALNRTAPAVCCSRSQSSRPLPKDVQRTDLLRGTEAYRASGALRSITPRASTAAGAAMASDYDALAWFYDRYWGPRFHDAAVPPLEDCSTGPLRPQSRVLDLCCGSGHLTERLRRRGYAVVGIDASVNMLRHARRRAPAASVICADAAAFTIAPVCEGAVSAFDSIDHVMTDDCLAQLFACVSRALLPGAPFVFDINTIDAYGSSRGPGRDNGQIVTRCTRSADGTTPPREWHKPTSRCSVRSGPTPTSGSEATSPFTSDRSRRRR